MNSSSAQDQAAHWAARLDAGPLTRTEAEALTRWLDEAPGHEGLLEEMQQVQLKVREVLPEMAASGRLPRSRAKPRIGPRLAWAGSLAAVLVVALAWFGRGPDRYDTVAGQRQTITLADGTLVEMNAQTGIDVRLDGGDRELRLRQGEIFLRVAKDSSRPFVVEAAGGRVRVTGTEFVVTSDGGAAFGVLLVEGAVEATTRASNARELAPGDWLTVKAAQEELVRLTAGQIADALAWREGRIVFNHTPLAEAIARFGAHHGRVITVAPLAQDLALGGRFNLDDFGGFLRDLAVALPVVVHDEGERGIRIDRRAEE